MNFVISSLIYGIDDMITILISKYGKYICGNCRMQQAKLNPYCPFCNYSFSNYEELLFEQYNDKNNIL